MAKFEIRRPLVVDTETWYDANCSVVANRARGWVGGNWHYVTHPAFYCYLVSWFDLETREKGVIDDPAKFPGFIDSIRDRTFVGLNCGFDSAVLWSIDKTFQPRNTFDVGDMMSYLQYPRSLADAAKYGLGREVSKELRDFMKGKHYRDLGVDMQAKMRAYALSDVEEEAALYYAFKDKWPDLERWVADHTRRKNWAGCRIDKEYWQTQLDKVSLARSQAARAIPWVDDIDEDKPLSAAKLAVYCREQGIEPPISMAEDSEDCILWERRYGEQYPVVGAIRDVRKANAYYKKLLLIERLMRPDGTIPFATKYCAAPHTLRFSATQLNYQNLPKDTSLCDLRGCLVPPTGRSFVSADLSNVEARILPWLAGDREFLCNMGKLDEEARATDGYADLYEPHARRMFGYSDPRPLKKVDKPLREVTKTVVLQLGYQAGAKKFGSFIEQNVEEAVLSRVRKPGETNSELALRLVQLYRSMNPRVVNLWYGLDRELRSSVGGEYKIQLADGSFVAYFDLLTRGGTDPAGVTRTEVVGKHCRGDEFVRLYGGKITENLCQRTARQVLVENMYKLSMVGYEPDLHVHDESVCSVSDDLVADPKKAREVGRAVEDVLSNTPDWAPGLPLAAEATIMKRYAK